MSAVAHFRAIAPIPVIGWLLADKGIFLWLSYNNTIMNFTAREQRELIYWANNPEKGAVSVVNKMTEASVFVQCISLYKDLFKGKILEIGAGQGWASCIVKALNPSAYVIATDISQDAISNVYQWEKIFGVSVDQHMALRCHDINETDIDLVFCFQAAHHFEKMDNTLEEIYRILKPDGHCLFLYEPSCRRYIYPWAHKRVNSKRPLCPEDVLIYKDIEKTAKKIGFECDFQFYPNTRNRGTVETLYYAVLGKSKILQRLLPCTLNYHFQKASR